MLSCTQSPKEQSIEPHVATIINFDDINYYCTKLIQKTMRNYHISQKISLARALIIIFWRSTLPQPVDHHVLKERAMNINKKVMNIHVKIWILMNLTHKKFLPLASLKHASSLKVSSWMVPLPINILNKAPHCAIDCSANSSPEFFNNGQREHTIVHVQ